MHKPTAGDVLVMWLVFSRVELRSVRLVRIRRSPSKIFSEVSGNAGVESKARNWVESIARFGERANDSCPRERSDRKSVVYGKRMRQEDECASGGQDERESGYVVEA